jgi:hypothetical protein
VRAAADAADTAEGSDRAAVAYVLDNAPELVALQADADFRAARMLLT